MTFYFPKLTLAALALLASTGLASAGPGGAGHGHGDETAYGKPGDPKKPSRLVQVVMSERDGKMLFIPDRIEVRRGEQIKFALRNNGEIDHEIVVATLEENLKHAVEMQKNPEIVWAFTKAGEFDFSCLIPGHREAGMTGKVIVK
jgi:uncharacterized cupredoxin-like copper-binding protein